MFRNVVVGVDGRGGGRDAMALAERLAETDGDLLLAHVRSPGESLSERESAVLLERGLTGDGPRERRWSTTSSSPGAGLHELVRERGADLLVLGACRRGLAGRALIGDDTHASVHGLACPAAIAPVGYSTAQHPIELIGVGYDGSLEGEAALELARGLAGERGARVQALMVVGISPTAYAQPGPLAYSQAAEVAVGGGVQALLDRAEREVGSLEGAEGLIACGSPSRELEDFSDRVDLLIVGSERGGRFHRLLLGSTSAHLLRASHCPLLVLPSASGSVWVDSEAVREVRTFPQPA